jgi:GNAT superfamily N-acetyltransferase
MAAEPRLAFHPLTIDRWADLERLFGPNGAMAGCWCMWWRLRRSEFNARKGEGNRRAFREIVRSGPPPGLIAYADARPVGWCAVAPRESHPALERSRTLARPDAAPVWSITCFYVAKDWRRRGLVGRLIEEAAAFAAANGATLLESYPCEPPTGGGKRWDEFRSRPASFAKAGFRERACRSPGRPIMRRALKPEADPD